MISKSGYILLCTNSLYNYKLHKHLCMHMPQLKMKAAMTFLQVISSYYEYYIHVHLIVTDVNKISFLVMHYIIFISLHSA